MSKVDNGGPAFPRTGNFTPDGEPRFDSVSLDGMTLREWYAGQALAGLCANSALIDNVTSVSASAVARWSNEIADAMIAERKKGGAA